MLSDIGGFNDAIYLVISLVMANLSEKAYRANIAQEVPVRGKSRQEAFRSGETLSSKIKTEKNFTLNR